MVRKRNFNLKKDLNIKNDSSNYNIFIEESKKYGVKRDQANTEILNQNFSHGLELMTKCLNFAHKWLDVEEISPMAHDLYYTYAIDLAYYYQLPKKRDISQAIYYYLEATKSISYLGKFQPVESDLANADLFLNISKLYVELEKIDQIMHYTEMALGKLQKNVRFFQNYSTDGSIQMQKENFTKQLILDAQFICKFLKRKGNLMECQALIKTFELFFNEIQINQSEIKTLQDLCCDNEIINVDSIIDDL